MQVLCIYQYGQTNKYNGEAISHTASKMIEVTRHDRIIDGFYSWLERERENLNQDIARLQARVNSAETPDAMVRASNLLNAKRYELSTLTDCKFIKYLPFSQTPYFKETKDGNFVRIEAGYDTKSLSYI